MAEGRKGELGSRGTADTVAHPRDAPRATTPDRDSLERDVLSSGTRLGEFKIERMVGRGGMGVVYKALDTELGRVVALKVLPILQASRAAAMTRFKQEAQTASRVEHNHIVKVHGFGIDRGVPYIAMEYLKGETLADEIARGKLSVQRTSDVMLAVCSAVAFAHRAGVIHRDLKPSNIYLSKTDLGEVPKVLDFGISKLGDADERHGLTETGDILGTQQYLSPEQASGRRDVDGRSDEFALGVLLYECVTGTTPHQGSTVYVVLRNIVEGQFAPPSTARPDLPPEFERIILRAMSLRREDRFDNVRLLGKALLPYASEQGKWQWSSHYTMPEAQLVEGLSAPVSGAPPVEKAAGLTAGPQATLPVQDGKPSPTLLLRSTQTANRPAPVTADQTSVPVPLPPAPVAKSRRWMLYAVAGGAATLLGVLGLRALVVRPEIHPPAALSPVIPAPPTQSPAASAVPLNADRTSSAKPAPTIAPVPAPVVQRDPPNASARPRKRAAAHATKSPKVRYTPEGVPIL
jgi:serine/threonine-protein kinase